MALLEVLVDFVVVEVEVESGGVGEVKAAD